MKGLKTTISLVALASALPMTAAAQDADPQTAADIAELRAEIEALKAEVATLRATQPETGVVPKEEVPTGPAEPEDLEPAQPATTDSLSDDDGWSFTPRGRLMFDVAYVDGPGSDDGGLGFSNELRRGRLGASGDLPGGFGYKAELEFAGGDAEFADAFLAYDAGDLGFVVGHHNNFQGLEELTSSLHTSFIERAAFTDAFGFERRVGVSAQYGAGDIVVQGGVFTDSIADLADDNKQVGADARVVWMPQYGDTQLHLGGSIHYADLGAGVGELRYRQRPAVHSTDVRFLNTGSFAATDEFGLGAEAAAIFGRLHVAAEGYRQSVSRPGFDDSAFVGGYVEAGYFLTDDRRGYKGSKFDRVKPSTPLGDGGFGSLQVNARYDYLDLSDGGIFGGTQNAFQASLNWKPVSYVLFGLNAARIGYDDAVLVDGRSDYDANMVALRSQVDF